MLINYVENNLVQTINIKQINITDTLFPLRLYNTS